MNSKNKVINIVRNIKKTFTSIIVAIIVIIIGGAFVSFPRVLKCFHVLERIEKHSPYLVIGPLVFLIFMPMIFTVLDKTLTKCFTKAL